MWRWLLLLAGIVVFAAQSTAADDAKRVALVVGNSSYKNVSRLPNPANDADLLSRTLAAVGFQVTTKIDLGLDQMRREMTAFSRRLAEPNTVGFFFFAGHGIQINGLNYLIPIDADIQNAGEVASQSASLSEFLQTLDALGRDGRMNIVVLDACRNNPFTRGWRAVGGGLAPVDAPTGTLIAYSTSPGAVALDGRDGNSPYARGLASAILQPGLQIEETFKTTRATVLKTTANERVPQTPWEQSSLTGSFFFVRGSSSETASVPIGQEGVEIVFWNSVKDSKRRQDFEAYLRSFPTGRFADLARGRLKDMTTIFAPISGGANSQDARPAFDPSVLPDEHSSAYDPSYRPPINPSALPD